VQNFKNKQQGLKLWRELNRCGAKTSGDASHASLHHQVSGAINVNNRSQKFISKNDKAAQKRPVSLRASGLTRRSKGESFFNCITNFRSDSSSANPWHFAHVADRQYNSAVIFKTEFLILELEALLQIIHP